jgi:hypothetical protein
MRKRPTPHKRKVSASKSKAKKPKRKAPVGVDDHISMLAILESAERDGCFTQLVRILRSAEKAGCYREMLNWCTSAEKEGNLAKLVAEIASAANTRQSTAPAPIGRKSLLLPEASGFILLERWSGLFSLYIRGDEVKVESEPELAETEQRLERGYYYKSDATEEKVFEDEKMLMLEKALWRISIYSSTPIDQCDEAAKDLLTRFTLEGVDMMSEALSPHLEQFLSAVFAAEKQFGQSRNKAYRRAHSASCAMNALFLRAYDGMMRAAFPEKKRATGSGEPYSKALMAILYAKMLCADLRRLPTKTEVRERLQAIGIAYKSANKRRRDEEWRKLFEKAGLDDLPD